DLSMGRHPVAGLAAAFAGVAAGFSANLLLSGTDVLLGELTIEAAESINATYAEGMNLAMNWFFIAASVFLLTAVGTWVTERIVRSVEHTSELQSRFGIVFRLLLDNK